MDQENHTNESSTSNEFELANNTECTNLQHMVEDCIREIFSLNTLSIMDLCSIAETCKRFREFTQKIFPKTIKINGFDARCYGIKLPDCEMWKGRQDMKRIFENFGVSLLEVEIKGRENKSNRYLIPLVTKHCRAGNLKSLTIEWINITKDSAVKLKPVFRELQKLHFYNVRVASDAAPFSELDSLTDLKLVDVENCKAILENIFMKLERFEFNTYSCMEQATLETLSTFLSRHQSLKILSLDCSEANCAKRRILHLIIDSCCNELEELSIDFRGMSGASLQPLKKFSSLRALTLSYFSFENLKLFSGFTKLRTLVLSDCRLPINSNQFAKLSQLTVLKLEFIENRSIDVVGIISQLINLQEMELFTFKRRFVLSKKTFSRIVNIVKDRPHVLQLTCMVDFAVPNYDGKQRAQLHDLEASLGGFISGDDTDDDPGYLDLLDWRLSQNLNF